MGEIEYPKASSRRPGRRRVASQSSAPSRERRQQDLRRIGVYLRSGARIVLREYLGALRRMGLDSVEAATTLGSAFLHALLEEARSARAELTHELEHELRGRAASARDRARSRDRSPLARRRGEGRRTA